MNAALISDAKKALNAQNRRHREYLAVAKRRRRAALSPLVIAAKALPEMISILKPEDALSVLGGDLNQTKAALPRLLREARLLQIPQEFTFQSRGESAVPARPRRQARLRGMSDIEPWLADPQASLIRLPVEIALSETVQRRIRGASDEELLEYFERSTRLPWQACSELLNREGVLQILPSGDLFARIERARRFWRVWSDAREQMRAAISLGQVQLVEGAWGLLDEALLSCLLPGFSVPSEERRAEFLVHLLDGGKAGLELQFFSQAVRPAFRVVLRKPRERTPAPTLAS